MVHELIGIQDNKVDLRNIGNVPKDQQVTEIKYAILPTRFYTTFEYLLVMEALILSLLMQEVVLSSEQDEFFKANMLENFGDLGMNIKRMVDEFQQIAKSNQNIQTIGTLKSAL